MKNVQEIARSPNSVFSEVRLFEVFFKKPYLRIIMDIFLNFQFHLDFATLFSFFNAILAVILDLEFPSHVRALLMSYESSTTQKKTKEYFSMISQIDFSKYFFDLGETLSKDSLCQKAIFIIRFSIQVAIQFCRLVIQKGAEIYENLVLEKGAILYEIDR